MKPLKFEMEINIEHALNCEGRECQCDDQDCSCPDPVTLEEYCLEKVGEVVKLEARRYMGDYLKGIDAKVEASREATIDEYMGASLERAMGKTVQEFDRWGKPTGEPVDLNDYLLKVLDEFCHKEEPGKKGTALHRKATGFMQAYSELRIEKEIAKELKPYIAEQKEMIRKVMLEKGAEFIADMATKLSK